jgi:hypothetical protein
MRENPIGKLPSEAAAPTMIIRSRNIFDVYPLTISLQVFHCGIMPLGILSHEELLN